MGSTDMEQEVVGKVQDIEFSERGTVRKYVQYTGPLLHILEY